ncbi:carotenoid oxygenase family protein [Nocardia sp. X0981]
MRYLEGCFAPVEVEVTAYDLPVTGRIPAELGGRYVRNGPNPVGVEDPGRHVWGMGQGMVHGVRLRDGRAEWYRNRFVRVPGFAPMVHVIEHAGQTFAMAEGGLPPALLDDELNTVGFCQLGATAEGFTAGAHSKHDPRNGELHSLSYMPGREFVQYIVTDTAGAVVRAVPIAMPRTPVSARLRAYRQPCGALGYSVGFRRIRLPMAAGAPTRVGVMPRTGGAVRWHRRPVTGPVRSLMPRHETDFPHQPIALGVEPTSNRPSPQAGPGLTSGRPSPAVR